MSDSYVKQNCCPIRMLGNKSDIYLELSSINNISSIRLYIRTTMVIQLNFPWLENWLKVIWNITLPYCMMKLIFDWSKLNSDIEMNLYFFLQLYMSPLHGKFKTRKLLACPDPQYRIVIQCQNHCLCVKWTWKCKSIEELTDSTECNINDSHNDIIEELTHVQTDAMLLNEGACKSVPSDQKVDNDQNQNENLTQTEVQIESGPQSLRKFECTHVKIIFTYEYKLQNFLYIYLWYMSFYTLQLL